MSSHKQHKLGLVQTGGTIASVQGAQGAKLTCDNTILKLLDKQEHHYELLLRCPYFILSENAAPKNWQMVAVTVAELINQGVEGVVITHGTDTMAYTAAALSFMLGSLPVPVILTGAMLPSDDPDTDGRSNLLWSIKAALHRNAPHEVTVMFGGGVTAITAYFAGIYHFHDCYDGAERLEAILIRGTRAKKVSAWPTYFKPAEKRYAAFQSMQADLIGAVTPEGRLIFNKYAVPSHMSLLNSGQNATYPLFPRTEIDPRVIALRIHPGINPHLLMYLVNTFEYRGIILEGYGDGTLPSDEGPGSLLPVINMITSQGVCVCVTTSILGPVTEGVYTAGRDLVAAGALPLLDMTTECALAKLMWVLPRASNVDEAKTLMRENLAGEISTV